VVIGGTGRFEGAVSVVTVSGGFEMSGTIIY
jgi:hypothetical protein